MSSRLGFAACLMGLNIVGACTTSEREAPAAVPAKVAVAPLPSPSVTGPVLNADGMCSQTSAASATVIEPGIGECDLVRLKAKPATDVLIGEGRSGREVQVLYSEPGAKELYFFVNGRLDRIVKS